ncbi:MAG: cell division protein FtsQ/DivIB [Microthrixaceae bacterium]
MTDTPTRRPVEAAPAVQPRQRRWELPGAWQIKRWVRRSTDRLTAARLRRSAREETSSPPPRENPPHAVLRRRSAQAPSPPVEEVHPRIAQRRAEVSAQAPRGDREWGAARVLRWVLVSVTLLVTAVAAALFSPFADLDELTVVGVTDEPASIVREATGLTPGTAMFGIRPAEVRGRLESIGWVTHADVDVSWPDKVTVTVTPARPVALLDSGTLDKGDLDKGNGALRLLTSAGEVLDRDSAGPLMGFAGGLPTVTIEGSEPAGSALAARLLQELRPSTLGALEGLDIVGDSSVVLELAATRLPDMGDIDGPEGDWRIEVDMGDASDLPAKSLAVESMLDGTVERSCMERVDVSVPTRVTVRRSAGCTMPDGEQATEEGEDR